MARTELDLDHITAVCDRLTQTRVAVGLNITPTRRGYAIDARSVTGARRVQAAFTQLGYRANLPERYGRKDQVTITGWNRTALETRITALRQAVAWLSDSRDRTAADAIHNGIRSHGELHDTLRAAVEQSTGIITNPMTTVTGDHDCARLLETAHRLERDVTAHIRKHVQAAEAAVHLYRQYQPGLAENQARDFAVTAACTQGSPPGWPNAPSTEAAATDADAARVGLGGHEDVSGPTAETADRPGEHPASVAGHDQPGTTCPDGPYVENVPGNGPAPPAAAANRPGPSRGRATH